MVRSIEARAKLALAFCRPAHREGSAGVCGHVSLHFARERGDTVGSIGCGVSTAFGARPFS